MFDHLPPRLSFMALNSIFQEESVDVLHNYRCPLGVLFPVVILYRPASKLVLLANDNHFQDPQQFIDPHLCHTTSGFLNFVGALSLAVGQGSRQIVIRNQQALESAGLSEFLRWLDEFWHNGTWQTQRILVNAANPEEYLYDYEPPKDEASRDASVAS